jgi:PiT family inorganic phosphate transporter
MDSGLVIMISVVALALIFDYINGFHDTANAIATVVSTNVLPPRTAIGLAALANFVGGFAAVGGVAKTIGGDIADPASLTQVVVMSALLGAIVWNLITWYYGIPSSSSHALVGGIVGAVFAHRMLDDGAGAYEALTTLVTSKGVSIVIIALLVSPIVGLLAGFSFMVCLLWIFARSTPGKVRNIFRRAQLVSAGFMAFSHGSNDAQKAMGIITMALVSYFSMHPENAGAWNVQIGEWQQHKNMIIPTWVIVCCATAMGLGTAAGGWRVMKTMGHKIIKLRPIDGFAAESAGAMVILTATFLHAPVSTTHVIASSIMGVGSSKRVSAVRWGIAGNILIAWVLTIPISALVAGSLYCLLRAILGS